jgi:uncharacterized membrane protein YeiB
MTLQVARDGGALVPERRARLIRRNVALLLFGLATLPWWEADILHYIGLYSLLLLPVLTAPARRIGVTIAIVLAVSVTMMVLLPYERGWDWSRLSYRGLWTPDGLVAHTFFNGFHPVFPWVAFPLAGIALGRVDLGSAARVRALAIAAGAALAASVALHLLAARLRPTLGDAAYLLTAQSMPPSCLYVAMGLSTAALTIAACEGAMRAPRLRRLATPLVILGRLALTVYVAHVFVGLGVMDALGRGEGQPVATAAAAAATFLIASVLAGALWLRRFRQGPLEWLLRAVAGTGKRRSAT